MNHGAVPHQSKEYMIVSGRYKKPLGKRTYKKLRKCGAKQGDTLSDFMDSLVNGYDTPGEENDDSVQDTHSSSPAEHIKEDAQEEDDHFCHLDGESREPFINGKEREVPQLEYTPPDGKLMSYDEIRWYIVCLIGHLLGLIPLCVGDIYMLNASASCEFGRYSKVVLSASKYCLPKLSEDERELLS